MLTLAFGLMFAGFVAFITASGLCGHAARRLVDFQFQNYHDAWVRDGRPVGGKITRHELSFIGSAFASITVTPGWLFARPAWLPAESAGELLRRAWIRWFALSLLCLLLAIGGMVLFGVQVNAA